MRTIPERIKLMPDYECWCLWDMDPGEGRPYNIDPATLPLSSGLKEKLSEWQADYDSTLVRDDPIESGFKTPEEAKLFNERGWKLLDALRYEIPAVDFFYFDNEAACLLKEKPQA